MDVQPREMTMTKPLFVALLINAAVLEALFLMDSLLAHSGWSFFLVLLVAMAVTLLVRRYVASSVARLNG